MELKISRVEYVKVLSFLIDLRLKYKPTSNWGQLFANLADFAESMGVAIIEDKHLLSSRGAGGCIWPHFKVIRLQARNITKMVPDLTHEIGHLICFKAGMLRKYSYDEDLAEFLGDSIITILSRN